MNGFFFGSRCARCGKRRRGGNESGLRAGHALRGQISGKVFKERISPQWLGGPLVPDRLRDGREWVLVDGAVGKRQAFSDKAKFEKARDALAAKWTCRRNQEVARKDHWKSPDGKWRVFARDYNVWFARRRK